MDNSDLETLTELLYNLDPMGLTKMGAPWYEYEGEAEAILEQLHTCKSVKQVHHLVYNVFVSMFDLLITGDFEHYRSVANVIFKEFCCDAPKNPSH